MIASEGRSFPVRPHHSLVCLTLSRASYAVPPVAGLLQTVTCILNECSRLTGRDPGRHTAFQYTEVSLCCREETGNPPPLTKLQRIGRGDSAKSLYGVDDQKGAAIRRIAGVPTARRRQADVRQWPAQSHGSPGCGPGSTSNTASYPLGRVQNLLVASDGRRRTLPSLPIATCAWCFPGGRGVGFK